MADQLSQEQTQQIVDVLALGRKIEAIKLYREATGKGLAEAKEFIDALGSKLIEQDPEKYKALAAEGAGCASVMVLALSIGVVTAVLVKTIA